jgi:hypothetical protein
MMKVNLSSQFGFTDSGVDFSPHITKPSLGLPDFAIHSEECLLWGILCTLPDDLPIHQHPIYCTWQLTPSIQATRNLQKE